MLAQVWRNDAMSKKPRKRIIMYKKKKKKERGREARGNENIREL